MQYLLLFVNCLIDWLIDWYMGSEPLAPMHLGLLYRPFVPNRPSWEPNRFVKAPDGPQGLTLNILRLQKEGAQMRLPDRGQGLTPTENVGRGLILRTAPPAQWAVCQLWTV
jgi:hypothetical protein